MMLLFLFLTFSSHCFDVMKLNEVSVEYHLIQPGSRIASIPQYRAVSEVGLTVDLSLAQYLYLRSFVHSLSDDSPQVRHVGLAFEGGLRVWRIETGWYHHSEHVLEGQHPLFRFPVRDGLFLRIKLL